MTRLVALGIALIVVASGAGAVAADTTASATGHGGPPASTTQNAPAATDGAANQSDDRQFGFRIQDTSDCGFTCRDVTITTTNMGNETAENITVSTQLTAGETVVWEGNESVAELEPGESMTVTERVRLDFVDAVQVQQNGGFMTANTTVTWDSGQEQFTERRKVT